MWLTVILIPKIKNVLLAAVKSFFKRLPSFLSLSSHPTAYRYRKIPIFVSFQPGTLCAKGAVNSFGKISCSFAYI